MCGVLRIQLRISVGDIAMETLLWKIYSIYYVFNNITFYQRNVNISEGNMENIYNKYEHFQSLKVKKCFYNEWFFFKNWQNNGNFCTKDD